ncbi:glycolate oxidase, subunit GlcD [Rhinocladiella mackenziei CBS 650.93]|uniref:D-lactate dehydrogenase (cytochrome) n=1 Tax=Rhinocladiella mackenziei CBS 650.93 TaxID=1442369 RepID=A0A0D2GSG3_9EURO|nr:glycolate oxidase, subunit GlcD [Rhinocladiella mackenziei CBS 650.93]KIX01303.1 glycolate oxidase, subunit GlcD [Rhinocladiella mackenziei CBS 650.93]
MEKAIREVQDTIGEDSISIDDEVLHAHGYSNWANHNIDKLPVAVVFPTSTEEVSQMVKICNKYKIPIIPFSGGSSIEGNFAAPFGGMSFDFVHMANILQLHPADMDVVVQPSVSWMDLNEKIKDSGLFFPIDPGPSAKIGGMVGTNCSGTNAVRYGTMRDWVVNLTVVLADGQVVKTRRRPRKSSAGYNLTGLFVGSEGTLGVVTEITLKLTTIPEETGVGVVTFPSMRAAAKAAVDVVHKAIPVGAVEILDDVQMNVINRAGNTDRKWKETPTLFFKFAGTTGAVKDSIAQVGQVVKAHGGSDFEFARDEAEQKSLWSARKEALWSMLSLRTHGNEVWSTDVAVPLSRVADLVEVCKEEMDALGLFGSMMGHIGDGNFHETILYDGEKEKEEVKRCVHSMVQRAIEMEGTCTGEHGVGLGKKEFLPEELGLGTLEVMRTIKKSLDPHWLLNPGKIFDA